MFKLNLTVCHEYDQSAILRKCYCVIKDYVRSVYDYPLYVMGIPICIQYVKSHSLFDYVQTVMTARYFSLCASVLLSCFLMHLPFRSFGSACANCALFLIEGGQKTGPFLE